MHDDRFVYDAHLGKLHHVSGKLSIGIERFKTSAAVLDYIMQVAGKPYLDETDVGDCVRLIARLLNPQNTLCSGCMNTGELGKILADPKAVAAATVK